MYQGGIEMEKKVTRIKKSKAVVPGSIAQADFLLGKLGETQDMINEIESNLKKAVDELKTEALKKLAPLVKKRDAQVNSLFAFANPRKTELTFETRSVVLLNGAFGWRWTTPRVETAQNDEAVISFLKMTGNEKFVRVIEELDRQTLLSERPAIDGISYVQDDEFFVVPRQKCKKPKTLTQAIDC